MCAYVTLQHLDFNPSHTMQGTPLKYINCIPLSVYRRYCGLDSVRVELSSPSPVSVTIDSLFSEGTKKTAEYRVEGTLTVDLDRGDLVTISCPIESCAVTGTVFASSDLNNPVNLVHIVCTYHREALMKKKTDEFLSADLSSYHMTVIDNGETLRIKENEKITLMPAPNLGGSSGFTKGISYGLDNGYTHILLNDDDAYISPESVFRLIQFLRIVLPEYKDSCIAGIFMDWNQPDHTWEMGGLFSQGKIIMLGKGIDLSTDQGLTSVLDYQSPDYSAWTCCCFPSDAVKAAGLPLPLFLKYDDVEYGLRMKNKFIFVPGISVWHPTYGEYSLANQYYESRNRLVISSCRSEIDKDVIRTITESIYAEISSYRYDRAEEMLKGVEDFLKGPEFVYRLCLGGMHKTEKLQTEDLDILRKQLKVAKDVPEYNVKYRLWTLNGLFFPSIGDLELSSCNDYSHRFYRVGKVLYEVGNGQGVMRKRSRFKTIQLVLKTISMKRRLSRAAPLISDDYRRTSSHYSSIESWKKLWDDAPKH